MYSTMLGLISHIPPSSSHLLSPMKKAFGSDLNMLGFSVKFIGFIGFRVRPPNGTYISCIKKPSLKPKRPGDCCL